jgi:ceramide glucosyltransferase
MATTLASIGYQVASVLAARRWRRTAPRAEGVGEPWLPVSILKPVRGPESHAARCFASFCIQDYPEYELLFGSAAPDDPAAPVVEALADQYPAAHVRLIRTGADLGPNRKVCNLHGLAAAARHDLLLISDSDMSVAPDYLRRVIAPFHDPRVGLVTCPYRGAEVAGVPAALEALGMAAGFMPGVFVAALGEPCFAFGSTIAIRRETLARIGGFAGLVDYLADDYQMGRRVVELGLRVHLSSVVVDSVLGRRSFRESWSRRLRWARTVRACRPLGHLGSGLTHTTALALLTAALSSTATARAIVALALVTRLASAWSVAVVELESDAARRWFPLLPLSDLVETALWAVSLFGRTVLWRGQRYRLREGGRIDRA